MCVSSKHLEIPRKTHSTLPERLFPRPVPSANSADIAPMAAAVAQEPAVVLGAALLRERRGNDQGEREAHARVLRGSVQPAQPGLQKPEPPASRAFGLVLPGVLMGVSGSLRHFERFTVYCFWGAFPRFAGAGCTVEARWEDRAIPCSFSTVHFFSSTRANAFSVCSIHVRRLSHRIEFSSSCRRGWLFFAAKLDRSLAPERPSNRTPRAVFRDGSRCCGRTAASMLAPDLGGCGGNEQFLTRSPARKTQKNRMIHSRFGKYILNYTKHPAHS